MSSPSRMGGSTRTVSAVGALFEVTGLLAMMQKTKEGNKYESLACIRGNRSFLGNNRTPSANIRCGSILQAIRTMNGSTTLLECK